MNPQSQKSNQPARYRDAPARRRGPTSASGRQSTEVASSSSANAPHFDPQNQNWMKTAAFEKSWFGDKIGGKARKDELPEAQWLSGAEATPKKPAGHGEEPIPGPQRRPSGGLNAFFDEEVARTGSPNLLRAHTGEQQGMEMVRLDIHGEAVTTTADRARSHSSGDHSCCDLKWKCRVQ